MYKILVKTNIYIKKHMRSVFKREYNYMNTADTQDGIIKIVHLNLHFKTIKNKKKK